MVILLSLFLALVMYFEYHFPLRVNPKTYKILYGIMIVTILLLSFAYFSGLLILFLFLFIFALIVYEGSFWSKILHFILCNIYLFLPCFLLGIVPPLFLHGIFPNT